MDAKPVKRFTEQEARAKVGRTVQTTVEFYRVPRSTKGRVVGIHRMADDNFDVVIEWDLANRPELSDRFAKTTYEQLLVEL